MGRHFRHGERGWEKLSACRGRHRNGLPQEALSLKGPRDLVWCGGLWKELTLK